MQTHFKTAIIRKPTENFARGLTTSNLGSPEYDLISQQHSAYVDALRSIGLEVIELVEAPDYPDAHFVEDTAVILPEVNVITRPGADSRRGEATLMASVIEAYGATTRIVDPGTLDGGDVLVVGRDVFIGISERTNAEGAGQLGEIVEPHGYNWHCVSVGEGLHLKSDVNAVGCLLGW